MEFDDMLRRYFGTAKIEAVTPAVQAAGVDQMLVDLGLEGDGAKRFALWSLLHLLDAAPDISTTFAEEVDREAARNFIDLLRAAGEA